jgi:hypothetical protein
MIPGVALVRSLGVGAKYIPEASMCLCSAASDTAVSQQKRALARATTRLLLRVQVLKLQLRPSSMTGSSDRG